METALNTGTEKRSLRNPDWETIIKYTKVGPGSISKKIAPSNRQTVLKAATKNAGSINIELVCAQLKNDLEWYCNLPEKHKSETVLRNILDNTPEPTVGMIENWWILS
ncbi:MAG: hypothetical protein ACXVPN_16475 [Bacteroidia bacterium]